MLHPSPAYLLSSSPILQIALLGVHPHAEGKNVHVQIIEAEYKEVTETEKTDVVELGGLHVIGTERHESRRIDNQLRGRGGR